MIIKSNFRDFYDSCVGYGIDKKIVYTRKTKTLKLGRKLVGELDKPIVSAILSAIKRVKDQTKAPPLKSTEAFFVGFCGKIYSGALMSFDAATGEEIDYREYRTDTECRYVWDARDFTEEQLSRQSPQSKRRFDLFTNQIRAKNVQDWISSSEPVEMPDLFFEHNLTCFVVLKNSIVFDPNLETFRFQRVMDGTTAFQEIMMHVSGLASARENIQPMDDKTMRDSKGFDDKSFKHR